MEQRAILDAMHDAVLVVDADGTVIFANRAAHAMLASDSGSLEGRAATSLLVERYRGVGVPRGMEGQRAESSRAAVLAGDGRELPVEIALDPADIAGRKVTIWTLRDARGSSAQEQRRLVTDALSAMADAFVQMSHNPGIESVARIVVDTLVARLCGAAARAWTYDAATGQLELVAWGGLPPAIDGAAEVGREPARYGLGLDELVVAHRGRSATPAEIETDPAVPGWFREQGLRAYALYPLLFGRDLVGAVAYLSRDDVPAELFQVVAAFARHAGVALHDVGGQARARRQIEALAREAHARAGEFEAIVSNMPDAVFLVRDGAIVFVNRAATRMLGARSSAELEVPIEAFHRLATVHDADGAPLQIPDLTFSRVLRGEIVTGEERQIRHMTTGNTVWVQFSGAPLRDAAGNIQGGVAVATEITRLKELEHSKDEWLAIAAHELRTPLTPITVHLQMAQRRMHMGRPISPDVFDKALEQVKRLARLVNGLLDVTRLQAGQLDLVMEDVDLRDLAEAIVDRMRPGLPRHTIVLDMDPQPVLARGDRARLSEVIDSLLDNAVKYSPDGGEIWVRVHGRGAEVRVEVRDQGIGIGPDERTRIFERYFRAGSVPQTQYGGLGLGLWIAGKVVQKHGGRIELESETGQGSTFCVVLPQVSAHAGVAEVAPHAAARARVLVVDDDVAVLEAVEGLLDDDGYDVRLARSGGEALAEAKAWVPDVVLLDLRMPGMDGWEVRRRFAADPDLAQVPVVLVSADRDARARAASMDVQGFVAKPFDLDEIERVLNNLVPDRGAATRAP